MEAPLSKSIKTGLVRKTKFNGKLAVMLAVSVAVTAMKKSKMLQAKKRCM